MSGKLWGISKTKAKKKALPSDSEGAPCVKLVSGEGTFITMKEQKNAEPGEGSVPQNISNRTRRKEGAAKCRRKLGRAPPKRCES